MEALRATIEAAWDRREILKDPATQQAIRKVIDLLDTGELRCASPGTGGWVIQEWVKKAVVLYFPIQINEQAAAEKRRDMNTDYFSTIGLQPFARPALAARVTRAGLRAGASGTGPDAGGGSGPRPPASRYPRRRHRIPG